jgi:hypothetical protein
MTPREIILRNLELSGPDRIGVSWGGGLRDDFRSASVDWSPVRTWVEGNVEHSVDPWGNEWHRIVGRSQTGEVLNPAIADWAALGDWRMPDLDAVSRYEPVRSAFAADPDRCHLSMIPGMPFAICRYLRKMEVYLQDLLLERDAVDGLHDRVAGLLERMIDRYADAGAEVIFTCEDWGTQERLLISPALWREIYAPLYRGICSRIRSRGMKFILHSCGYIWEIIGDLVGAGVDCLQFDQPGLYGLERLAAKLRGLGVCLFAPVDIQKILPTGDRKLIEAEARKMIRLFGRGGDGAGPGGDRRTGGFIAKQYGDLPGIGVRPEWDRWAYDVFLREGAIART